MLFQPTTSERLYTGDFGATLKSALPSAVGAPEGSACALKSQADPVDECG